MKYYAKPNNEYFDADVYVSEHDLVEDNIWIGGNRDFGSMNDELRSDYAKWLEDCKSDIEALDNNEYDSEDDFVADIVETIRYYFKKKDKTNLSNKELNLLYKYVNQYAEATKFDTESEIIVKVLEIIYSEPFEYDGIRGYSQGDWQQIIYPSKLKDMIPFIEAVYFGTGTEWRFTLEKINNPDDFDAADTSSNYTELWKDDDVKQWLADQLNCAPNEIELLD